ncbi:hypothetical protein BLSTO_05730 [Blastocystis sp. subtype 1]
MSLDGSNAKLTINGQSLSQLLEDFHWDETRFPVKSALNEHKNTIQQDMKHGENEMKKMIQKYQDVHSNVIALKRKRGTNILTTPLSLLLKEEEVMKNTSMTLKQVFVETEYLQTVVLILSSSQEKEFLAKYKNLGCDEDDKVVKVVPESGRRLLVDGDGYTLYSVVVLKKYLKKIQEACRENRYTLRVYEGGENSAKKEEEDEVVLAENEAKEKKVKSDLLQWCRPNYAELASEWVHLKCLRVYTESLLRYGLHTTLYTFILFPKVKVVAKLQKGLETLFAGLGGSVDAYNLVISAVAGSESTSYTYACVSVERLSAWCVCLSEFM